MADEKLKLNTTAKPRIKVSGEVQPKLKVVAQSKPVLKIRKPSVTANGVPVIGEGQSFTCPYCIVEIEEAEAFYECSTCHTRHHTDCWEEAHGCSQVSCRGIPSL